MTRLLLQQRHCYVQCQASQTLPKNGKMIETHFKPALNKRAEDIYSWVNVIVKMDWSFVTVNDDDVRGIMKISSICEKTLKTYMHGIGKKVTKSIQNILSGKLYCIVFDGWDDGSSNYYVAIFAVFGDSTFLEVK